MERRRLIRTSLAVSSISTLRLRASLISWSRPTSSPACAGSAASGLTSLPMTLPLPCTSDYSATCGTGQARFGRPGKVLASTPFIFRWSCARSWGTRSIGPTTKPTRLQHRLVKIHPFPNGNGRHARIMADTVLDRVYKAKPIDWTGGHDLQKMNKRRTAYIAALKAADQDDIGPLM